MATDFLYNESNLIRTDLPFKRESVTFAGGTNIIDVRVGSVLSRYNQTAGATLRGKFAHYTNSGSTGLAEIYAIALEPKESIGSSDIMLNVLLMGDVNVDDLYVGNTKWTAGNETNRANWFEDLIETGRFSIWQEADVIYRKAT